MMDYAHAVSALRKAGRGLKEGQTDRTRRNARAKVRAAVKKLLAALDAQYPAPRRIVARRTYDTPAARLNAQQRRLERAGFVLVNSITTYANEASLRVSDLALVGIRVQRDRSGRIWIPRWTACVRIGDLLTLRRGKMSPQARKAIQAEAALAKTAGNGGAP